MEKDINTRRDESVFGKLSSRTRSTLEALIRSPLAEQAIEQAESESLAGRRALIAELAKVDSALPSKLAAVEKLSEGATQALARDEQAYLSAKAEALRLQQAHYGLRLAAEGERKRIKDQLREGADSRLADFRFHLSNTLHRDMPMKLNFWVEAPLHRSRGADVARSNTEECVAAKAALREEIARTEGMQLEALSYAEIGQELIAACQRLAPLLAKVELNPPRLTAAECEVGAPLEFRVQSEFIVERLPEKKLADKPAGKSRAAVEG